jgi:hypothetical protein
MSLNAKIFATFAPAAIFFILSIIINNNYYYCIIGAAVKKTPRMALMVVKM